MCGTYEVLVTKASKPCSEAEARTNGAMPRHHDPAPVITLDQYCSSLSLLSLWYFLLILFF